MDDSDHSDSGEAIGCIVSKTVNYINIGHVDHLQHEPSIQKPPPPPSPLLTSIPEKPNCFGTLLNFGRKVFGDTTRGLKHKLRNFYSEATLPCVSWLGRGQDLLLSDYYVKLQLANNCSSISLEDIFAITSGGKPSRILVEGQPGYGKTTLATKIVFDWATKQTYLKRFKLAFLLPLRELRRRGVKSALDDISRLSGFGGCEYTKTIIEDNMPQTLLVLDGIDELPIKERIEVLQILFKQVYREMTVIVTCRTGLFNIEECELSELFGGFSKKKVFYDKRVVVVGVGIEDREKFLSKFVSCQNPKAVLQDLQELTLTINDVFQSPLFLILLSMFVVKKKALLKLTTRTILYKTLVNCIIRRSIGKTGVDLGDNFDLFDEDDLKEATQNYKTAFYDFGILCLDKVLCCDLQFECNDLTSMIYEMGFLINHKNVTFFELNQHFEAFHVSIMEFASAFALYNEIKCNNDKPDREAMQKFIRKITSIYCHSSNTSLILPFLFGLLGKQSTKVFHQLRPIAHLFSLTDTAFWSILSECTIDENFLASITQHIPLQIQHSDNRPIFQSSIHEEILRAGIDSKQITNIWTTTRCPPRLPQDVTIPHLSITVHIEECLRKYDISQLKNAVYDEISFAFQNLSNFKDDALVCQYINLFCKIKAKTRSLCLSHCCNDAELLKNINATILEDVKLNKFAIALSESNTRSEELLFSLLRRNQVKSLDLFITSGSSITNYTEILQRLGNSEYLEELNLRTMPNFLFEVDLYLLTKGGQKEWKILMLRFLRISCNKPVMNKHCIQCLITKTVDSGTAKAINNLDLQVLECDNVVLYEVTSKLAQSWQSFDKLVELIIVLDKTSNNEDFWEGLTNLKRLKLLEIIIPVRGSLTQIPINKIVSSLQLIPIERFVLWRACKPHDFGFTKRLIQEMKSTLPWRLDSKSHPLSSFDFGLLLTTDQAAESDLSFCVSEILESVRLRYLENLNIITNNTALWYTLLQDNIVDPIIFKVVHSLPGVNENDPAYNKIWCDNFCNRDVNQLCISLR